MHWLTQPATSRRRRRSGSRSRACKDLREIPGVRNCGSHIGQALLADEVYGVDFGENWISVDPNVDYDKTLGGDPPDGRGLPRPLPRRADLPARAHQGGADRDERVDRRAHLRPGPRRPARRSPTRSQSSIADDRRRRRRPRRLRGGPPAHRGRGRPRRGAALRAQARRRPPAVVDAASRARRSATSSTAAQAYDVHVWSIPAARNSLTDVQRAADRHARRRPASACEQVADVRIAPTPERHPARAAVAPDRRRRERRGARPRLGRRRRRGAARERRRSRSATTPRCSASRPSSTPPRTACCCFGHRRGDRDLPAAAGGLRQPAAGGADLPAAADGAGRRRAGRVARRRRALARLARRLPDGVRHRRAQRDPDDQPLPAPRARRGRAASGRRSCCAAPRSGWRRS